MAKTDSLGPTTCHSSKIISVRKSWKVLVRTFQHFVPPPSLSFPLSVSLSVSLCRCVDLLSCPTQKEVTGHVHVVTCVKNLRPFSTFRVRRPSAPGCLGAWHCQHIPVWESHQSCLLLQSKFLCHSRLMCSQYVSVFGCWVKISTLRALQRGQRRVFHAPRRYMTRIISCLGFPKLGVRPPRLS